MSAEIDKIAYKAIAKNILKKWDCLPDGDLFFTHSSLLWPVKKNNIPCMLKIVKPDDDEAHSGEILHYYNGNGAVKILDSYENVQLLERAVSTKDKNYLENMVLSGDDDGATHIICDVIDCLHSLKIKGKRPDKLIPFLQRSDVMRDHIKEGRVDKNDLTIFSRALSVYQDLLDEFQEEDVVLHGDVHHFNILHSDERGWLAIDPKGILGPRIYEYANMLCNPYMHTEIVANKKRMARQAAIISERTNFDKKLLLKFTYLHACQCAAWSLYEPDQSYWLSCAKVSSDIAF